MPSLVNIGVEDLLRASDLRRVKRVGRLESEGEYKDAPRIGALFREQLDPVLVKIVAATAAAVETAHNGGGQVELAQV